MITTECRTADNGHSIELTSEQWTKALVSHFPIARTSAFLTSEEWTKALVSQK